MPYKFLGSRTQSLLCIAVLTLVALATLIGHLCRSNGQVHLVSALTCGVIASVSGIILRWIAGSIPNK